MDQSKASFTSIGKRYKGSFVSVGDTITIICKNGNTYIGKVLLINERFVTLLDTKGNVFAVWRSTIDSHLCEQLT